MERAFEIAIVDQTIRRQEKLSHIEWYVQPEENINGFVIAIQLETPQVGWPNKYWCFYQISGTSPTSELPPTPSFKEIIDLAAEKKIDMGFARLHPSSAIWRTSGQSLVCGEQTGHREVNRIAKFAQSIGVHSYSDSEANWVPYQCSLISSQGYLKHLAKWILKSPKR